MNTRELHAITSSLVALGQGDIEVMVDTATFPEDDNGTVFLVEKAEVQEVQGADDSGPVGDKEPMLVIRGVIEWHEHGASMPGPGTDATIEPTITLTDGNGRNPRTYTKMEYDLLVKSGMMWEFHPDAPTTWPHKK